MKIFQLNCSQHEKLGTNIIVSLIYSKGETAQSELTATKPAVKETMFTACLLTRFSLT